MLFSVFDYSLSNYLFLILKFSSNQSLIYFSPSVYSLLHFNFPSNIFLNNIMPFVGGTLKHSIFTLFQADSTLFLISSVHLSSWELYYFFIKELHFFLAVIVLSLIFFTFPPFTSPPLNHYCQ